MKKMGLGILGLIILVVMASGCIGTGSGKVVNQTRDVSGFSQISTNGDINLFVKQGTNESLVIEAENNVIPNIKTTVSNGRLTIDQGLGQTTVMPTKPVNVYVTVKDLSSVDSSGSGYVETDKLNVNSLSLSISGSGNDTINGLTANTLKVVISGSGSVTAAGKANSQDVTISGSGEYNGSNLTSNTASVNINGSGKAIVYALQQLSIIISGSGEVNYLGNPKLTQQISGSGKVTNI